MSCGDDPASARSRVSSRPEIGPDLQAVIDAWPDLPAALQAGILAMIRTAKRDG